MIDAGGASLRRPARTSQNAGRAFYQANQAWVDHHNALVDELGIWNDGLLETFLSEGKTTKEQRLISGFSDHETILK